MTATLDVLRKARELLSDEKRWCKGSSIDSIGRRCLIGAVAACDDESAMAYSALQRQINLTARTGYGVAISTFNDAPSTTHTDVLGLLDKAIAAEEAK